MARKRTELEEELMTDSNIERVIKLLEPKEEGVKPITKKEACSILGMAYNTTRLGTILEKYKEKKAKDAERRAALRGKPVTKDEIVYIISEYLGGGTIDSISKYTYRSAHTINKVLADYAVPIRASSHDYFKPILLPEEALRDQFKLGEVVYSARYDSTARIDAEKYDAKRMCYVYRIWLISEKWKQFAYQEAYELASLQHLRELGVRV